MQGGACSAQAAGFALGLEQRQNVALAHGALDVAHDEPVLVVQELDAHLRHLAARPGAADDLHDDGELGGAVLLW